MRGNWSMETRLDMVRTVIANVSEGLSREDYRTLMESLVADAEGWKMELEEAEGEEDDT